MDTRKVDEEKRWKGKRKAGEGEGTEEKGRRVIKRYKEGEGEE